MQPVREVYSLLMPVKDGRIIVPRAAVAEVMGYSKPKDRPENAPVFLLGYVDWQGQRIPLVSFEAARGQELPEFGRRTRIAVVFGTAGRLQPDVFAVVTQGYPYLVRVNENVLQREAMSEDEPLVLARVRMANEKPYIPDFERLEQMVADALGQQPPETAGAPVDELESLAVDSEEDFDAGVLLETGDAPEPAAVESAAESGEAEIDLGAVTAFGIETSYSEELDELSDALASDETVDETEAVESAVNLDEVTAFGAETDYSAELGELSGALDAVDDESDAIELSIDDLDVSALAPDAPVGDDVNGNVEADDAIEIDFSDLEIDFGDDDDGKNG